MSDLDVLLSVAIYTKHKVSHPEEICFIQISLAMAVLVCVLVVISAVTLIAGKCFVYFVVVVIIPV